MACHTSLLQRDVRDFADIEGLHDMPRLLSQLGAHASSLLNIAEVSRATGFTHSLLLRHLRWAGTAAVARHFRAAAGKKADLVLETPDQRVVDIEIKASASLNQPDLDGLRELRDLRDAAGWVFTRGVVLYTGEQLLPFEDKLWAVLLGVP